MLSRCQSLPGRPIIQNVVIRTSHSIRRAYATADPEPAVKNPLRRRKGGDLGSHLPKHVIPSDAYIPAYPYGDHALFKQANNGLYGDQMIHFGNNVSRKTETKTRRDWKPNVLRKSLYSVALKKKIKLRITSKVLKTMDREGGLDEYLLKDNEHRLKELGPLGWALRWTLMQKPHIIDRMRAQAAALGLDQATIDAQWPTLQMLNERSVSQAGLVRATDLVGEEENEEYDDAEGDVEKHGEVLSQPLRGSYSKLERRVMKRAASEYKQAVKAARRYLDRGHVESEAEGLKLAFIRVKERKEAAERNKQSFAEKLKEQFSDQDVAETRERFDLPSNLVDNMVREIAYNQWRRQEIEKAGNYEVWRAKIDAERGATAKARYAEANGGKEPSQSELKQKYAKMIEEAESAATNKEMPHARREFLKSAIAKAEKIINGAEGDVNAYVESARQEEVQRSLRAAEKLKKRESRKAGGDPEKALVN